MKLRLMLLLCFATPFVVTGRIAGGAADVTGESPRDVKAAVGRGLAQVQRAGVNWQKNKTCFSCHHQTLPMLAMVEASRAGFPLDKNWLKSQADVTHKYFADRIEEMDEGEHVPGGATTAAYGLWALGLDQRPPDQTTTSIVHYLLQIQGVARLKDRKPTDHAKLSNGRWVTSCRRPPLQGSEVADTVLVLIGMEQYAMAGQQPQVAEARATALKWLAQAPLKDQQDRSWRLWGVDRLGGDADAKAAARSIVLKAQREDGGWGQADDRPSDAYATGLTLFVLCRTGISPDDPAAPRARDYLLKTQLEDGSWLVESQLKFKAQPYFDNGDPHGEHQFLSTAATAWATAALVQFLPPKEPPVTP